MAQFPPFQLPLADPSNVHYANGVALFFGPWDFTIVFFQGVPTPSPDDPNVPIITQGQLQRIVMSPQHAKALMVVLRANMEKWEEQFGKIQLPQEVLAAIGVPQGDTK